MTVTKRVIQQKTSLSNAVYRILDVSSLLAGLFLVLPFFPENDSDATVVSALAAIGIYMLVAELTAMYRSWHGVTFYREFLTSAVTWGLTLVGLSTIGQYSVYTTELNDWFLLSWFSITPVVSTMGRVGLRQIQRFLSLRGVFGSGYVVIGATDLGIRLVRNIEKSPELGLRFLGFYDDRPGHRTAPLPSDLEKRLGTIEELVENARSGKVSKIFITLPMRAESRINKTLEALSDSTASVYIVPDFFVFELLHSRWTDIQGIPVVSVFENPFYGVDGVLKRVFDITVSAALILVLAIPMLIIAALVKGTSRGPVIFRQKRYGLDGKEFFVFKFRSMTVCENGAKVTQAKKNDARVTPLGAILRKTSLDELPQLFNVLFGSMSLVGPRPHATAHNEEYRQKIAGYMLRHKVKPGITGLAQVLGFRGETDTLDKMQGRIECDHRYIREWSIWLDLKIMFKTISVVLSKQNAY